VRSNAKMCGEHTCCDSKTGHKVVEDSPHDSLRLDRGGEEAIDTEQRHADENNDMKPIEMFVPI